MGIHRHTRASYTQVAQLEAPTADTAYDFSLPSAARSMVRSNVAVDPTFRHRTLQARIFLKGLVGFVPSKHGTRGSLGDEEALAEFAKIGRGRVDDAMYAVSELAANAVMHAEDPVVVTAGVIRVRGGLHLIGRRAMVFTVTDSGPRDESLPRPEPEDEIYAETEAEANLLAEIADAPVSGMGKGIVSGVSQISGYARTTEGGISYAILGPVSGLAESEILGLISRPQVRS